MAVGHAYWVIVSAGSPGGFDDRPHAKRRYKPAEPKHWWGSNRSGHGWTPYPGNAYQYDSENAALHVMYETEWLRRTARGEVSVERRTVASLKSASG